MLKRFSYVLIFLSLFFVGALSSNAEELKDGVYEIQSALNASKYIDLYGSKTKDGSNIHLYQKNGSSNQKWIVKSVGNGYYTVTTYLNSKYSMDIYGATPIKNGSNVQLYNYGNTDNQKWLIKDTGDGYYNIISKKNNLYLDVCGSSTKDGTNILAWEGTGGNNQRFKFIDVTNDYNTIFPRQTISDGNYIISSAINDNKVINIDGMVKNGTNIDIYDKKNTMKQIWNVKYLNNGYYSITSAYDSAFGMDIYGATPIKAGSNLHLYKNNNGDNQIWYIKDAGDGYYYIISKKNNLYIDLFGSKTSNGSNIGMWSANGGSANQKFKFTDATDVLNGLNDYNDIFPEKSIDDGNYVITSAIDNSYALNIDNTLANETNVNINKSNNSFNEAWTIKYLGEGYYSIISAYNNKYSLDIYGAAPIKDGSNVQISNFNNTDNQKWIIKQSSDGYYYIVSKKDNLFLNVSSDEITNGTNTNVSTGKGTYNQKFKLEKTNIISVDTKNYYTINSSTNNKMGLNIARRYKTNNSDVIMYNTTNNINELWKFKYNDDGFYTIQSALNPSVVLDVTGSSDGAGVKIYKDHGGANQKWTAVSEKDGSIRFISASSGMYMTMPTNDSGSKLEVSAQNDKKVQKFVLKNYTGKKLYTGIDVSSWQQDIDWNTVSKAGVDFAIIRAGYGEDDSTQDDIKFAANVSACEKYNIPYAVYLYSYARDENGAISEANHVLRVLKSVSYKPNLNAKVFYDMEANSTISVGKGGLTNIANKFCSTIKNGGYSCGIYANVNWFTNYLNADNLKKSYKIWLANYPAGTYDFNSIMSKTPNYGNSGLKSYNYWQFASDGTINGIKGNVDLDLGYDIFD